MERGGKNERTVDLLLPRVIDVKYGCKYGREKLVL